MVTVVCEDLGREFRCPDLVDCMVAPAASAASAAHLDHLAVATVASVVAALLPSQLAYLERFVQESLVL